MKHILLALGLALAVAGCTTLPEAPPQGAPGYALAPQPGGALESIERAIQARAGPDRSGFLLLDSNEDGLRWRLALVDSAQHSLDLQYYVWWGDDSGDLLSKRVIDAADRGVKVRIILDDLSTILGGRNIGNEYFGLSPEFNFRDLDVLGIGAVARQGSVAFDRFWNSEWVVAVTALDVATTHAEFERERERTRKELESAKALARAMERDMAPENAWRVSLAADGHIRWTSGDRVLTTQPARSLWQRIEDVFFMAFPRDLY